MELPTIAALVVSAVYFIAASVAAKVSPDPQSGIAIFLGLILLLVLPYTVNCLVTGGCTWYAWAIPGLMVLMLLIGLLDAVVGSQAQRGGENKNMQVRKQ